MANLARRDGGVSAPLTSIFPSFFSDVDRLFNEDMFMMPMSMRRQIEMNVPSVNIRDREKDYLIEVAAPGMRKEDFNIDMEQGVLTISSQKEDEKTEDKESYHKREYNYSSFSRSFTLPENLRPEEIKAHYENGILSLTVPKKQEQEKPKQRIKID
ncbi:heat-shock protein Hsp20 [Rufibacter radiotolerans]|uniref:Heat-shock protein Hsp20 n=1 Tax=Rufibacter radiotolerans TaxID=1379910 RepID=A0A0H4W403_9BACT|nr:Hsp20/alpha crystallin family protein [Rufibacter radiotolerans]AKQ45146.1 heat-shock protein Hsp20 [Rufibacter radiotolerans]